ncbi:hypothetical protein [Sinomonas sp. G460-2]|uniref:hypothetical protein n=1 Tax=Sinomonas sp. G460-2 TaxID=3393464 RepID=UPI0039EE43D2
MSLVRAMTSSNQIVLDAELSSSLKSADLVLIGDADDVLVQQVCKVSLERGLCPVWAEQFCYTRQLTVRNVGATTEVSPDLPLFIRNQRETSGEVSKFVRGELFAQRWSTTALMTSPVINRPTTSGITDYPPRHLMKRLHSSRLVDHELLLEEHYSSAQIPDPSRYEGEELSVGPANGDKSHTATRYRSRMPDGWIFQQVLVVGDRAWVRRETADKAQHIRETSIEVAKALDLNFCVIHWRKSMVSSEVKLARVSGRPTAAVVGDQLGLVSSALVDLLMS